MGSMIFADWLHALLEGFLRHTFLCQESYAEPGICDIREDVVAPVLDELWDDSQKHCVALENHLDFLPSHLGTVKGDKVALSRSPLIPGNPPELRRRYPG